MYKKDAKHFGPWIQFSLEKDLKLFEGRSISPKSFYFVSFRSFRFIISPLERGLRGV